MILIVLAVLGRIMGSVLASVWQKRLYQSGESPYRIVAFSMTMVALATLLVDPGFLRKLPGIDLWFGWFLLLSALLDTIGNLLLVKSVGAGELSIVGPINSYKPVIAIVLGVLFFDDHPSLLGGLGILAIMIGSWWLVDNSGATSSQQNQANQRAVWIRLGSITMTSTASLFLKSAISLSDSWIAFQGWAIVSAILAWIFLGLRQDFSRPSEGHTFPQSSPSDRARGADFIALGISLLFMQGLTIWLFSKMSVGYALALFQLSALIQVILGAKLFGEQDFQRRFLAACVMTVGAIVVLLAA
jgi:drug/metabolite transporter (DMT)-like permease